MFKFCIIKLYIEAKVGTLMIEYFKKMLADIGMKECIINTVIVTALYIVISLQPYMLSKIFTNSGTNILVIGSIIIFSFLAQPLVNFPNNNMLQRIRKSSKKIIFESVAEKGFQYSLNHSLGKTQSLINEASFCVRNLYSEVFQFFFKSVIMAILYTSLLVRSDFKLGIIYLISVIIFLLFAYKTSSNSTSHIQTALNSSTKINEYVVDYFRNIDTIASRKTVNYEAGIYNELLNDEKNIYYHVQLLQDRKFLVQQIFLILLFALQFVYLMVFNENGRQLISESLLIMIYSIIVLSSFSKNVIVAKELFSRLNISLNKLDFNGGADVANVEHAKQQAGLKAENLGIKIREKKIFDDLNFSFKHDEKIHITGENGSGKSTLVKIISGLLKATEGSITISEEYTKSGEIAYFSQTSNLFNRTIRDNLLYPDGQDLDEKLIETLREVGFSGNNSELLTLLDEYPGDLDGQFSGGEKQRILLARMLLSSGKIVIIDELDSALDSAGKEAFTKIINEKMNDRLVLVISHSDKTGINFDREFSL
jgi:ABC-type transport system involved in cytochrome bd biosynthesis fused ATPase/permease subunit